MRTDYLTSIDTLRASAPPEIEFTSETEVSGKRPHRDVSHWQLIFALELRVDVIDQEFKVHSTRTYKLVYITDSAKRVEEARQKQGQEFVDSQHTTEPEEVDELLAPATRSKGTAVIEEEPATEEGPVKEGGSVSDTIHSWVIRHRLRNPRSTLPNPQRPVLNQMYLTTTMKRSTSWRTMMMMMTTSKTRCLEIYPLLSPQ